MTKTGAFLTVGDRFKYWNEVGTFVEWAGNVQQHSYGKFRSAQVFNADHRLVVWVIDQTAQIPLA